MEKKPSETSAESFVGSVFKFSISTYINFLIYGVAILITGIFVPPAVNAPVALFLNISTLVMNIAVLGLDQSFIRFFNEPPAGLSEKNLFGLCFCLSAGFLVLLAFVGCFIFPEKIVSLIGIDVSFNIVPFLFLNAFLLMMARYFNVAYRMEQNIPLFTLESVLMQFFSKLFYLTGAFSKDPVFTMVLCCVLGTGAFVLFFTVLRRRTLLPQKKAFTSGGIKTLLPYGLALAPTAVLLYLNSSFSMVFVQRTLGDGPQGIFSFATTLSNVVTVVQAGFATFWGAFVYANYRTEQPKIRRVHDYLDFIILVFFTLLVIFENLLFWILPQYKEALLIFPLMMLAAVFTILSEGTVYGICIARKPIFDTMGIALSLLSNIGLCYLLVPRFGLLGAAGALALSSFLMFLFRTLIAQRFYATIDHPAKTASAILICIAVALCGCAFADRFLLKGLVSLAAIGVYCLMYQKELVRCWQLGLSILKALWAAAFGKRRSNKDV